MVDINNIPDIPSSEIKPRDKKDYRCAPSQEFSNGSCISLILLIEMAKAYNQTDNQKPIKLSKTLETLNPKKYKKYLIKEFSNRLDKVCDDQRCWVKQDFIEKINKKYREALKKDTFRPAGPEGRFDWLSTFNINDVMGQYEYKYNNFKFLGAVPIDFDELPTLGISNLDFNDLIKKGKTKIGIVFNLDEHYKSGTHWISLYACLDSGCCYFFDSFGIEPNKRIRKFMRKIANFIQNDLKKKPNVDYNRVRHQKDGYSCGVYSVSFIIKMLEGRKFEDIIIDKNFDDALMLKNREVFFT
ncbi:Ulp1 protease [uncultured virus]|nr:Ulp1 protease [uncultured virus]